MSAVRGPVGQAGFMNGVLSIRGILALLVASSHTIGFTAPFVFKVSILDQKDLRDAVLKLVFGTINVPMIFFVISGIAIARSLERKGDRGSPARSYAIFILRRIMRLYPAQLAAVAGIVTLVALGAMRQQIDFSPFPQLIADRTASWLDGAVFNPLKWRSIAGNAAIASWSMNPVTWTLCVEVCAIPLLPLFYRLSTARDMRLDIAVLTLLCGVTLRLPDSISVAYLFAFYLGMMAETHGPRCARFMTRCLGGVRGAVLFSLFVLFIPGLERVDWTPALLVQAFGAFALICVVVWCQDSTTFCCLDHRLLKWAGRLSYSFYLWHYFVLTLTTRGAIFRSSPRCSRRMPPLSC